MFQTAIPIVKLLTIDGVLSDKTTDGHYILIMTFIRFWKDFDINREPIFNKGTVPHLSVFK